MIASTVAKLLSATALAFALISVAFADVVKLLKQGLAARLRGDDEAAIHYLTEAIVLGCVYRSGLAWARKGEYDRAIADFTEATHGARTAYLALNNRGNDFSLQGKHHNALEDYSRSIELNPQYADAYKNRGDTYKELGDTEKANDDFKCSNTPGT
jgi:tetratricopeptide (TPR) repeat protein